MVADDGPAPQRALPLLVLTGFLGSGKTTVLSELLRRVRGPRIAVLVNEVGELALDGHLLERVDEDVLLLASGCVCCSLRGDLYAALARVAKLGAERIVLETTGVADPAPIVAGLGDDARLAGRVGPVHVVAVADAARIEDLLPEHAEVRSQLEYADRIVLTKTDLRPECEASARELLHAAAPGREVRSAPRGRVDPGWLLDAAPFAGLRDTADARLWLNHHAAGPEVRAHAVTLLEAADVAALALWLRLVTQLDGPRLLRFKALVECDRGRGIFALQSAGRCVSPPRRLAHTPAGLRGVSAVLIERGLAPEVVLHLRATLRQAAEARPFAPEA